MSQPPVAANAAATTADGSSSVSSSSSSTTVSVASRSSARSGSIVLPHSLTSCSHINVCRPWISWKKGNMSEYVSKPRVFFDHFHHQIVLFTGSPPNKMWFSDRKTQTWMDYPVHLPPHNDIIGAQFSPDRSHVALRVSDKEVKVLSTSTGEVVTARSCRGTSSRMISVHWLHDPALAKNTNTPAALFLLFVTNAGVELYELTNEKSLLNINLPGSSNLTGAAAASGATPAPATTSKLKHIKTATYNIVYHWILLDENILLLVDTKNVFQAYKLSSKQITKICKFELDCGGTSLNPPQMVQFHREQISLVWLYGRMVIIFVNEVKGQLHLLSLSSPSHSEEMEQTHVFDLYQPGRYDVSNIDNVLVVHNTATRVSMLFDVRSESKTTITEPLPIGPPLNNGNYVYVAGGGNSSTTSSPAKISSHTTVTASGSTSTIDFFDPAVLSDPATKTAGVGGVGASPRPSPGMASLAPANFHPYVKWTFLSPCYVWESTGDQQQGNLWTLQMNYQQIAYSWPHSKRTRLVDFLLKRSSVAAKQLILQLILQIVCTEPHSLALLSRLFSLINRMNYDHRMNPNAAIAPNLSLANLPLLPPFSNPPSAASTAPNSNFTSPFAAADGRSASASVSASPLKAFPPNSPLISNAPGAGLPSFGSASRMSVASASPTHRASTSISSTNQSFSNLSLSDAAGTAAAAINNLNAAGLSFELDDSLSVLSCEMLDITTLLSQPMTVEHNLHGYILISQLDIFLHVFERARPHIPLGQLIPVVVEYLRSIHRHFLKAEDILNDYLVSLLLAAGRHFEFHQYLQYHILNDSLPIANRLISCAHIYPPAYQLGIDMLYRLNQIPRLIRVMLNHHQVLAALQLIPSYRSPIFENAQGGLTPRDFLSTAWNTGDRIMFYHTFKFFEQRNIVIRNNATFLSGDGCDQYVFEFNQLFGNQPPPPAMVLMNAGGSGARGSVAASSAPAASSGAATSNLQAGKLQYLNLGDDDDEVLEDDDIEYDEEGIANFASTASAAEAAEAEAAAAAESASSSSFMPSPTSEKSEVVQIPAPLDLSTTIPSVTVSSGAGEEEEDNAAESGLGVDQSTILEPSMSSDSLAPEITSPHLTLDGSFGGLSGNTSTPAPHDGKKKKPAKNFKAEPAM